jgi:putative flippase GtrA
VPVDWVDDPDSRVRVLDTALKDLRGVWRISHGDARRVCRDAASTVSSFEDVSADQLFRFAGVGVLSTLAYLFLFVGLRPAIGLLAANAVALALCTLGNTATHWGLASRSPDVQRGRMAPLAVGLFALSVTLTSLALLGAQLIEDSSLPLTLVAVTVANTVAAVLRFAVLRTWVFRPAGSPVAPLDLVGT